MDKVKNEMPKAKVALMLATDNDIILDLYRLMLTQNLDNLPVFEIIVEDKQSDKFLVLFGIIKWDETTHVKTLEEVLPRRFRHESQFFIAIAGKLLWQFNNEILSNHGLSLELLLSETDMARNPRLSKFELRNNQIILEAITELDQSFSHFLEAHQMYLATLVSRIQAFTIDTRDFHHR
jgi:hypothetical protein